MTNNAADIASDEQIMRRFFTNLLSRFSEKGIIPDVGSTFSSDVLTRAILTTMKNEEVQRLVRSDVLCARIFRDTMELFVQNCLNKKRYHRLCAESEFKSIGEARHWSFEKRQIEIKSVLEKVDRNYAANGFPTRFYTRELLTADGIKNDLLWETFLNDWEFHLQAKLQKRYADYVEQQASALQMRLLNNMREGQRSARQHTDLDVETIEEVWALMEGRWIGADFERLLRVALIHRKYPMLNELFGKLGCVANAEGNRKINTSTGWHEKMQHASKSDISGISEGRDFSALLPLEWVQFLDAETEDVFLQKYVTGHLQTFLYQSAILNPMHSLQSKPAATRGPMIVCVDTSGSMIGKPEKIAMSMLMRLSELCASNGRSCFLIGFSVNAHPIDLTKNRGALLHFFGQTSQGNTDAKAMLTCLFNVLHNNHHYVGADVLWITDFVIPIPGLNYLSELEKVRHQGTKFYGLQIGIKEHRWLKYFDNIYKL